MKTYRQLVIRSKPCSSVCFVCPMQFVLVVFCWLFLTIGVCSCLSLVFRNSVDVLPILWRFISEANEVNVVYGSPFDLLQSEIFIYFNFSAVYSTISLMGRWTNWLGILMGVSRLTQRHLFLLNWSITYQEIAF